MAEEKKINKIEVVYSFVENHKWLVIVIIITGLFLSGIGMSYAIQAKYLKSKGIAVSGKIVSVISDDTQEGFGEKVYFPVVSFEDLRGMSITFKDNVGAQSPHYKRGDEVEVIYNPDTPGKAFINRTILGFVPAIFCVMMGVAMLCGGIHNFIYLRNQIKIS